MIRTIGNMRVGLNFFKTSSTFKFSDKSINNITFNIDSSNLLSLKKDQMDKQYFEELFSDLKNQYPDHYSKVMNWLEEVLSTDFNHESLDNRLKAERDKNTTLHQKGVDHINNLNSIRSSIKILQDKKKIEIEKSSKESNLNFLKSIIGIVDDVVITKNELKEMDAKEDQEFVTAFLEGFKLIEENTISILKRHSVFQYTPKVGDTINQIKDEVENEIGEDNKENKKVISSVISDGFVFDNVLIKKAKVISK